MIYHDFDYVNPLTQKPQGDLSIDYQRLRAMAETTARSQNTFDPFNMTKGSKWRHNELSTTNRSPGKSVYMASERNSIDRDRSKRKFGGHVAQVRALKNVQPFLRK